MRKLLKVRTKQGAESRSDRTETFFLIRDRTIRAELKVPEFWVQAMPL